MSVTYNTESEVQKQIRKWIVFFMVGLVLSGITAFPIETQLSIANDGILYFNLNNSLTQWIQQVYEGVKNTNNSYPFISYGTDWLAFAHLILAVLFIGPLRDPVRNSWVIEFGLIACVAIFPLALIAGAVRGIPVYWRLIDCSFGVIGGSVLWICYNKVKRLELVKK